MQFKALRSENLSRILLFINLAEINEARGMQEKFDDMYIKYIEENFSKHNEVIRYFC